MAYFFLDHLHLWFSVRQDGRFDPVPSVTLWPFLSARHEACAFFDTGLNVGQDLVALVLGDEGAEGCGVFMWLQIS